MNAAQLEVVVRALETQLKYVEKQQADDRRVQEKLQDQLRALQSALDKTQQQLTDHVAQVEKWDARRWTLIVLLLGAVLSLASGLIVTLARK